MKKTMSLLLIIVLCYGILVGCGGNKVPAEKQREEIETSGFDSKSNKIISIRNIFFEIPGSWEKGEDSREDILYFYPDDAMLMVQHFALENLDDETVRKEFLDGFALALDKYKLISEESIEINGNNAYRYKMQMNMHSEAYESEMVLFNCNDAVMAFMMSTLSSSEKNYIGDFRKILDSIHIDDINLEREEEQAEENQTKEQIEEKELTGNILFDTDLQIDTVISGEWVGHWGKIRISKEDVKQITENQFRNYMNEKILEAYKDTALDWICIVFGDGTGLNFIPGVAVATYGEIDNEGGITKQIGIVMPQEDGMYIYEEL